MTFVTGILSILQVCFLTGHLALLLSGICLRPSQRVCYSILLSVAINYYVVALLVALNSYTAATMWAIFVTECALTGVLQTKAWRKDTSKDGSAPPLLSSALFLAVLAPTTVLTAAVSYSGGAAWGQIFHAYDDVQSWNRWAQVLASGIYPLDTWLYPPTISASFATTYVMTATSLQFFAKMIVPIMAIAAVGLLYEAALFSRRLAFLIATLYISTILLMRFDITWGYADVPVLAMSTGVIVSMDEFLRTKSLSQAHLMLALATSAAITKQSGLALLFFVCLTIFDSRLLKNLDLLKFLCKGAILAIVPYIIALMAVALHVNSTGYEMINQSHENPLLLQRLMHGMSLLTEGNFNKLFLFATLLSYGICIIKGFCRALTALFVLPWFAVWACYCSYDLRNLAILVPPSAYVCGIAGEMLSSHPVRLEKIPSWSTNHLAKLILCIPSTFLAATIQGNVGLSKSAMIAQQAQLARNIGNADANILLEKFIHCTNATLPLSKIGTTYTSTPYFPGLENRYVGIKNRFRETLEDSKVTYLLKWAYDPQDIAIQYAEEEKAGRLVPVKTAGPCTLYRIVRTRRGILE